MRTKISIILILLFLFPSLGLAAELYTLEKIKKVISGDTFQLESGKKIRLIGIDAPENEPNQKAKDDSERTGQKVEDIVKMGKEATEWVRVRLEGKNIFLKHDQKREDDRGYEWVFAYLYDVSSFYGGVIYSQLFDDVKFEWFKLPERGKFTFLNATIVRAGYATPVSNPPNVRYAELFERAYREAQESFEGLWNVDYFSFPCTKEGEKIGDCAGCVVKCCKGLEPMFSLIIDGECQELSVPGSGGYCSNCGNNICESKYLEDNCNCPKDCN